ncbi:MAG: hypothetical protein Q7R30_25340, partial [Acidobacteriota bacterium]|nr:hypothetical protein [Acidobacteriota bacterium]
MQANKPPDTKTPPPTAFAAAALPAFKLLGQNYTTPDLVAKVTGKAKYAEDFRGDGMVFVKLMPSPRPHARVVRVDASAALAMPGVHGILRASDLPVPTPPGGPPPAAAATGAAAGGAPRPPAGSAPAPPSPAAPAPNAGAAAAVAGGTNRPVAGA